MSFHVNRRRKNKYLDPRETLLGRTPARGCFWCEYADMRGRGGAALGCTRIDGTWARLYSAVVKCLQQKLTKRARPSDLGIGSMTSSMHAFLCQRVSGKKRKEICIKEEDFFFYTLLPRNILLVGAAACGIAEALLGCKVRAAFVDGFENVP